MTKCQNRIGVELYLDRDSPHSFLRLPPKAKLTRFDPFFYFLYLCFSWVDKILQRGYCKNLVAKVFLLNIFRVVPCISIFKRIVNKKCALNRSEYILFLTIFEFFSEKWPYFSNRTQILHCFTVIFLVLIIVRKSTILQISCTIIRSSTMWVKIDWHLFNRLFWSRGACYRK